MRESCSIRTVHFSVLTSYFSRVVFVPIISCRHCGKPLQYKAVADLPHFPFCSERCRLLDLGEWLDEEHRIPTDEKQIDESERLE